MRLLTGYGTPRETPAARRAAVGILLLTDDAVVFVVAMRVDDAEQAFALGVLVIVGG